MSPLPQHRKSAEEIAKLRETLGVPGPDPSEETLAPFPELPASIVAPVPAPVAPVAPVPPLVPLTLPEPPPPQAPIHSPVAKQVRSLKRAERIPILPSEHPVETAINPDAAHQLATKIVKSLRKSEQVPVVLVPQMSPDSKLPTHRHSDQEITRLRRNEMLAGQAIIPPPPTLLGKLLEILPGYVVVLFGTILCFSYDLSYYVLGASLCIGLLFAGYLFLRKPLFRHHAAFIAVLVMLVAVFGALYYFPQLRYGT
jgi:hypothetical protein